MRFDPRPPMFDPLDRREVVYALAGDGIENIKIGYTMRSVRRRLREIGGPNLETNPLRPIALAWGGIIHPKSAETRLLDELSEYRCTSQGEWVSAPVSVVQDAFRRLLDRAASVWIATMGGEVHGELHGRAVDEYRL